MHARALTYPFVLGLALVGAAAPAGAQDAAAVAHQLVVSSGVAVQLRSLPKGVSEQIGEMRGRAPDALLAALEEAGKEAFQPEPIQREIERLLPGRLKVEEMRKAIAWLETAAGRRVTRAEELASSTMDEASLKAYAEQSKAKPPTARRRKLLQGLIGATNAIETSASVIEATALGVAIGMDSTLPVQKRAGAAALRAQIRQAMPPEQIRQALNASLPGIFAYTYRDVSDADLAAYDAFLRGADGKKYNDAMLEVFGQALVAASMRMGQLVEQSASKRPI